MKDPIIELNEVRNAFDERLTGKPELRRLVAAVSKLQWIETSYAYDADVEEALAPMSAEEIIRIIRGDSMQGDSMTHRSLKEHIAISNYHDMVQYIYGIFSLKDHLDRPLMERVNAILRLGEENKQPPAYRQHSPVLRKLNYDPCSYLDVEEKVEQYLQRYYQLYDHFNTVQRACWVHTEFMRIYPFESHNEATARALMNFELMAGGYVPMIFSMNINEYRRCIHHFIRLHDGIPMYRLVIETEINRYYALHEYLERNHLFL